MKELGQIDILSGVYWNGLQLVVNQTFGFGVRLLLAYLLTPEDFGLVGMAVVLVGFVGTVNELGITAALVQRKESRITQLHYDTAFWTGVVWSIVLYGVMAYVVAPIGVWFYGRPEIQSLTIVMSLSILLAPLIVVGKATLIREVNFKYISIVETVGTVCAGVVALVMALGGSGVWALASMNVIAAVIAVPLYWVITDYRPALVWNTFAFKDIFSFGAFASGTSIVNYVISNIDYLVIGRLVNANALGMYTLAFILTDTVKNRVAAVVSNVMYPIYASMQDDHEKSKVLYSYVVEYNCLIIYPLMVIMILFADDIIRDTFGLKWADAVLPLQLLGVGVMMQCVVLSNTTLIRAMGFAGFEFKLQLLKGAIYIPIVASGIYLYGIVGAALAVTINRTIAVGITLMMFRRLRIEYTYLEIWRSCRLAVIMTLVIGFTGYILSSLECLPYVVVIIMMGLMYVGMGYFSKYREIGKLIGAIKSRNIQVA